MEEKSIDIYLVSLEQDTARRDELKLRFPEHYNSFNIINAVDGRKITAKEYYDKTVGYFLRSKRVMSPGELGAALSHIKALETFLETQQDFALIFEDDVIGEDSDIDKVYKIADKLGDNFLLLCGTQDGLFSRRYQFGKKTDVEGVFMVLPFSYRFVFGAFSYVVSREAARAILEHHRRNLALSDHWGEILKKTQTDIYQVKLFKHPSKDTCSSHLEADRVLNTKTFWEKVFAEKFFYRVVRKIYNELFRLIYSVMSFEKL